MLTRARVLARINTWLFLHIHTRLNETPEQNGRGQMSAICQLGPFRDDFHMGSHKRLLSRKLLAITAPKQKHGKPGHFIGHKLFSAVK